MRALVDRARSWGSVGVVAGGTAVYSIAQWLILVLFARATSQAGLGEYAYALSVSAPFFILFGLSLRQVYVSDVRRESVWREYLSLRVVASAVALVAACGFALMSGTVSGIYVTVALIKATDLVADIYLAPAQAVGRVRALGVYQAINGAASLALFALGLALGLVPVQALAISLGGSLLAGLYALSAERAARVVSPGRSPVWRGQVARPVWRLAMVAAPLGLAGFLNSAAQAAPRYVLEREVDLASVGVFSAMAYLLVAGNMLVGAVVQYELPRVVASNHEAGRGPTRARIRILTVQMAALGCVAVGFLWWSGEYLMTVIYGPGYDQRASLILLALSWAVGAVSWIWDLALVVERAFVVQMFAACAGAAVSVVISLWAVPSSGVVGAAAAVLGASLAVAGVRLVGLVLISTRPVGEGDARNPV